MATYFFVALTVMVIGIIGAFANVVFAASKGLGKSTFMAHALFGLMYVLGFIASLVTGWSNIFPLDSLTHQATL